MYPCDKLNISAFEQARLLNKDSGCQIQNRQINYKENHIENNEALCLLCYPVTRLIQRKYSSTTMLKLEYVLDLRRLTCILYSVNVASIFNYPLEE